MRSKSREGDSSHCNTNSNIDISTRVAVTPKRRPRTPAVFLSALCLVSFCAVLGLYHSTRYYHLLLRNAKRRTVKIRKIRSHGRSVKARRKERIKKGEVAVFHNVGRGQCFVPQRFNYTAPCATCVDFVTLAVVDRARWAAFDTFPRALRAVAASLRESQRCFRLYVYTNLAVNSTQWDALRRSGGSGVVLRTLPPFPRNSYTGKNSWLALSRSKLDMVTAHAHTYGTKPVWVDMDTLVLADLSCAVGRARNFVVSRGYGGHWLRDPGKRWVRIHERRSAFGDLWMADATLADAVVGLEQAGMPAPEYDLQDYFSFLLNRCDGTVLDLRSLFPGKGNGEMCFGFDFAEGDHPSSSNIELAMSNGKLHCVLFDPKTKGDKLRPVASLAFLSHFFRYQLLHPESVFWTPQLKIWAQQHGFVFKGSA